MTSRNQLLLIIAGLLCAMLVGCTSMSISTNGGPKVNRNARWVLLPSVNNTETPQAGGRLDSIAATLLRVHDVNLTTYAPSAERGDNLFDPADKHSQEEAMNWAKRQKAQYAVAGSVDEWRYKVGLEGEPAAGISLSIIDLATGQVIWSGSAARTGSSKQAISALAQDVVNALLNEALSHSTASGP